MKKLMKIPLFFFIIAGLLVVSGSTFFAYCKWYKIPDLTVIGYINQADGIGRQAIEVIDTFKKDYSINLITTRKNHKKKLPANLRKYFTKDTSRTGKVVLFEEILWVPNEDYYRKISEANPKSIKFAYSMWESSRLPNEWVRILNTHFDGVLVPSFFLVKVYQDSGVKIPVFELPLGLDMTPFLKEPIKEKKGTPMVFANLSACNDRKNQLLLIQAFVKAFGDDPSVFLRINSRWGEANIRNAMTKELINLNLDNVLFTYCSFSQKEYVEEFKKVDCYVSPSKGEGFSIQPREAMILGIPVIATNNTGQSVVCASGLVRTVECPLLEPACYPWGDYYGQQYNCKIDELAAAMRDVKDNYAYYLAKGKEAREWASQWQYKNVKPLYRSIICPKKVELGEENKISSDKIVTNSKELLAKYRNAFKTL